MRLCSQRILVTVGLTLCVGVAASASVASAATPVTQIKRISPASGPELSSIPVTIHGSNFNTSPGQTTISFGGSAASSVSCASSKVCTAMSPELPQGSVEVSVTSNGMTSATPVTFTNETYSPPVVQIISRRGAPAFSKAKLRDRYAGIFDPGNIYLQIENTSGATTSITGPTGTIELNSGETAGYNMPVDESSPYTFKVGSGSGMKQTLTVKTKTPK